jgi:4,5:9,10-diseco-3-hydroxy-5,9,17-trioxoandrosta-1(10),2-diene-4-oate hydrolase
VTAVVGVHAKEVAAGRLAAGELERGDDPPPRALEDTDAPVLRREGDLARPVGRTVIDDEDLEVTVRLDEHGAERLAEGRLGVARREEHGGRGHAPECKIPGALSEPLEFEDVPYPYPERSVTAAGVRAVYIDEGEGVPVVFLPAAGRGLTHDAKLYPVLRAAGRRVVGVDLPGWGKSEKPDATYSVEWYLHWIESFLDAALPGEVVLAGNSLGGLLAAMLASRLHDRVKGAALVAPAGGPVSFVKRQVALYMVSESRLRDANPTRWRLAMSQYFHRPIPELEELVARGLSISRGKGWPLYCRALARGAKAALSWDLVPHLARIRCPVLLLWGREDRVCPVSWVETFEPELARARVRIIEGCGHFPAIERPEDTAKHLLEWLREEVVA